MKTKFLTALCTGTLLIAVSVQAQPGRWSMKPGRQAAHQAIPHLKAQTDKQLPMKAEEYLMDASGSGWSGTSTYIYAYDNRANRIEETEINYDNPQDSLFKTKYSYNFQGEQTSEEHYSYDFGIGWRLSFGTHTSYTYNGLGKQAGKEIERYNSSSQTWGKSEKSAYTYDGSGRITEMLDQEWDGSAWANTDRTTVTYTAGGAEGLAEEWDGNAWVPKVMLKNMLWGKDDIQPEHFIMMLPDNGNWVNDTKHDMNWLPDGGYVIIEQVWENNAWENFDRMTLELDAKGNASVFKWEEWDGSAWSAYINSEFANTYDGDKLLQVIQKDWDDASMSWKNSEKTVYSNFAAVVITSLPGDAPKDQRIYPNPVQNILNIETTANTYRTATLTDLSGRTITTQQIQPGSNTQQIDMSNLQSGVYLLQLQGDNGTSVQKVVKK